MNNINRTIKILKDNIAHRGNEMGEVELLKKLEAKRAKLNWFQRLIN